MKPVMRAGLPSCGTAHSACGVASLQAIINTVGRPATRDQRVGAACDLGSGLPLKAQLLGHLSRLQVHHVFPKALL